MKFRKDKWGSWEVLIKRNWYSLCACENCKEVHAGNNYIADKKIKCCEKPDNFYWGNDELVDELVDEFVKKWSDEE